MAARVDRDIRRAVPVDVAVDRQIILGGDGELAAGKHQGTARKIRRELNGVAGVGVVDRVAQRTRDAVVKIGDRDRRHDPSYPSLCR